MDVLEELKFQQSDFHPLSTKSIFKYDSILGFLYFVKFESSEKLNKQFYDVHREIWNENKSETFIAIIDETKIIICDSKIRPDPDNSIENVKLKSFNYGENTAETERYKELLKKENIDNGFFWEEISRFITERKKKRSPIDDDLLSNLVKTRENLQKNLKDDKSDTPQKLIDRCLFIRFIEDRLGFSKLKQILNEKNSDKLLDLFKDYNGALNGDLFEDDNILIVNSAILHELERVFGEYYVYSGGQKTIIPYNFDKIPILLISQIYQKFLSKEKKEKEGIVFTPENIVDFTINSAFESQDIVNKARTGKIKILDSACGSGIFLVKSFEKVFTERQLFMKKKLDIHEKSELLKECIYGIDLDQNALRVAAFSLYLKIFEGIEPKTIKEEVFDRYENGLEHFMFPGLRGKNLINANSLFDEVLEDKFDLILGNPPWGFKFGPIEKQKIDTKWGKDVSNYQSSQCFLHQTENWMKEDTVVGMVVNISNFTNSKAKKFRDRLLKTYSIFKFITLTKIKEITFIEPSCILIFALRRSESSVEFLIPELTQFSKMTGIITIRDTDRFKIIHEKLNEDIYWHICLLGLNRYLELISQIENTNEPIKKYFTSIEGPNLYSTKKHGDINKAKQEYESEIKKSPQHYPLIDSIKGTYQYRHSPSQKYIDYGSHLKRFPSIESFKGNKLVIIRSWPPRAFSVLDTIVFSSSFDIFKLKDGIHANLLFLFEAILNSKLVFFYLAAKYLQREDGNFSKVNKGHLEEIPIPYLENKDEIISKIIYYVSKVKEEGSPEKYQDKIDDLIFNLYELDYYEKIQILDYYTLQNRRNDNLVNEDDFNEYIAEFQESFSPLIKEGYMLNAECYTSNFLGALIKFNFSTEEKKTQYNLSKSLKKFIDIIHRNKLREIDYKPILEEKKLKIYDKNSLIIYKSNHLRDWTRTEAINDVKEEMGVIYSHLPK